MAEQLTKEEFLEEVSGGYEVTDANGIYKLNYAEISKLRRARFWPHQITGNAYLVVDDNANSVTPDQIRRILG